MPHVDGLQATAQIMTTNPRPIVIVSSESREGADSTLKALELGAIDFVPKPSSGIDLDMQSVREDLLRKVRMSAKVRVVRTASRLVSTLQSSTPAQASPLSSPKSSSAIAAKPASVALASLDQRFPVVVLGASTGGPATVMRLAPGFTREFPAAVFLVQHMPASFTTQYAAQLAEFTGIRVKEAEANESVQPGTLYICPGGPTSLYHAYGPHSARGFGHPAASTATCPTSTSPWNPLLRLQARWPSVSSSQAWATTAQRARKPFNAPADSSSHKTKRPRSFLACPPKPSKQPTSSKCSALTTFTPQSKSASSASARSPS